MKSRPRVIGWGLISYVYFCSKAILNFVSAWDDRAACMLVLRLKKWHWYNGRCLLSSVYLLYFTPFAVVDDVVIIQPPFTLTTKGQPIGLSHGKPCKPLHLPSIKATKPISITYYSHNRLHLYLLRSLFLPFYLFCDVTHISSFHPLPTPTIFLLSQYVQAG